VALLGDQYVLRLEAPVDHSLAVKDAQAHDDLLGDGAYDLLGEGAVLLAEVEVEIAEGQVLHDHINSALVLECFDYLDQEIAAADRPDAIALEQVELPNL
jgi:hypothetical protein